MNHRFLKTGVTFGIIFLCALTILSMMWPLYRISFGTLIATNEGWNACYQNIAIGKTSLYPALNQLITNNYPPLSFYVVGFFGKLIGDNVLAGRLLSLLALVVIAFFIRWRESVSALPIGCVRLF